MPINTNNPLKETNKWFNNDLTNIIEYSVSYTSNQKMTVILKFSNKITQIVLTERMEKRKKVYEICKDQRYEK